MPGHQFPFRRRAIMIGMVVTGLLAGGCTSTGSTVASSTASKSSAPPSSSPAAGLAADCRNLGTCYVPRSLRAAYGIQPLLDRGISGRGVTVVLLETAVPATSSPPPPPAVTDIRQDLALFDRLFGLPAAQLQVVTSLAGSNSPYQAAAGEVRDAEIVHAVAPDAAIRVVPAIAVTGGGQRYLVHPAGGTAAAAAIWAGLIALADQDAGHALGLVNPVIYRIGRSPAYSAAFHPITAGTNTVQFGKETITGYQAASGWNPVTGWGSPNARVLIPLLVRSS
jgi:subtilase family serine protease